MATSPAIRNCWSGSCAICATARRYPPGLIKGTIPSITRNSEKAVSISVQYMMFSNVKCGRNDSPGGLVGHCHSRLITVYRPIDSGI